MCQWRPSASVHSSAKIICGQRCALVETKWSSTFRSFRCNIYLCNTVFFSLVLPHHRLSIVVSAAQHGASRSGSFHHGRSRSNPRGVPYMWSRQSRMGASTAQHSPLKQTRPFLHRWCFRRTVIESANYQLLKTTQVTLRLNNCHTFVIMFESYMGMDLASHKVWVWLQKNMPSISTWNPTRLFSD